jgi:nucleoside-diphosphate-sugar epimerase
VGGREVGVEYGPPRKGDVRHSLADVSAAHAALGYTPSVDLEEGLAEYMTWIRRDSLTRRQLEETQS